MLCKHVRANGHYGLPRLTYKINHHMLIYPVRKKDSNYLWGQRSNDQKWAQGEFWGAGQVLLLDPVMVACIYSVCENSVSSILMTCVDFEMYILLN